MFLRRDNQAYEAHREALTPVFLRRGNHVHKAHTEAVTPVFLRRGNHVHKAHTEVVGQSRLQSTQKEGIDPHGTRREDVNNRYKQVATPMQVLKKGQSSLQSTQKEALTPCS